MSDILQDRHSKIEEISECNDNGGTHRNLIAKKIIEDIQLKNADKMYTPKKSGGNEDCQKD